MFLCVPMCACAHSCVVFFLRRCIPLLAEGDLAEVDLQRRHLHGHLFSACMYVCVRVLMCMSMCFCVYVFMFIAAYFLAEGDLAKVDLQRRHLHGQLRRQHRRRTPPVCARQRVRFLGKEKSVNLMREDNLCMYYESVRVSEYDF